MITLHGDLESPEGRAARTLAEQIREGWPGVEASPTASIHILAGTKCHGQRRSDLDLVLLAHLPGRPIYRPFLPFDDPVEGLTTPEEVAVSSLCLVIEVKDHDPTSTAEGNYPFSNSCMKA
jgi:hypothetical protein